MCSLIITAVRLTAHKYGTTQFMITSVPCTCVCVIFNKALFHHTDFSAILMYIYIDYCCTMFPYCCGLVQSSISPCLWFFTCSHNRFTGKEIQCTLVIKKSLGPMKLFLYNEISLYQGCQNNRIQRKSKIWDQRFYFFKMKFCYISVLYNESAL